MELIRIFIKKSIQYCLPNDFDIKFRLETEGVGNTRLQVFNSLLLILDISSSEISLTFTVSLKYRHDALRFARKYKVQQHFGVSAKLCECHRLP
jgi:hypothetical protein